MRIFFAVPRAAWVELNIKRSLVAMGHELVEFTFPGWPNDNDPEWRDKGKPETNQKLLEAWREARRTGPVDLFYGYFYSSVVYPSTIKQIRSSGVPTVNFSCNNVHQFDLVEEIVPHFDLCVVPEQKALADYQRVCANFVRIQMAANPDVYRPYPGPREYDVTFVGQRYADRADIMCHLYRNGVGVRAWGAGWQTKKRLDLQTLKAAFALVEDEKLDGVKRLVSRFRSGPKPATASVAAAEPEPVDAALEADIAEFGGPRLLHNDLIRMYSQSRISLGFATAGDSHRTEKRLTHLRLREFEAPMSGALYLTEKQDELDEYYTVGEELLVYEDQGDLLDKARFYLAHPEEAERVRRNGRHRSLWEHTWQHRFRELFQVLGLKENA